MQAIPSMDNQKYIARDFFTYELDSTVDLAPAGSVNLTQSIDTDSDFFWTKACVFVDVADAGTTEANKEVPNLMITVTDGTTGRSMSNAPVPVSCLFGYGSLPFILPVAKYFGARSLIQLVVSNPTAGTTYSNIRFSFHGVKAFLR